MFVFTVRACVTPQDVLDLAFKLPERLAWARACPTMGRSKPRLATGRECLAVSLDLVRAGAVFASHAGA